MFVVSRFAIESIEGLFEAKTLNWAAENTRCSFHGDVGCMRY